jgi:hypothetical protein
VMTRKLIYLFAFIAVFSAANHRASADVILASQTGSVSVNSNNPINTVTNGSYAALQGGTASLSIFPFVSLLAQVNDPAGVATQDAFAILSYQFAVVGGNPGDVVPVDISTVLSTSATYPNYAFAEFYTDGSGSSQASIMLCTDGSCPSGNSFNGTLHLLSTSGAARQLTIFIGAEEGFSTGGNVTASADPYIFIDPAFADASLYQIEVSDGIGNELAPAVPEPSTWAMLILGFAGIGFMACRRKFKPALMAV